MRCNDGRILKLLLWNSSPELVQSLCDVLLRVLSAKTAASAAGPTSRAVQAQLMHTAQVCYSATGHSQTDSQVDSETDSQEMRNRQCERGTERQAQRGSETDARQM